MKSGMSKQSSKSSLACYVCFYTNALGEGLNHPSPKNNYCKLQSVEKSMGNCHYLSQDIMTLHNR